MATYTLIVEEGVVLDANGHQVAPCQSELDPAFVAYCLWVAAGNQPTLVQRGD